MSDFKELFVTNNYIGPIDIYAYSSKEELLGLFSANPESQHLGTVALAAVDPKMDYDSLTDSQQLEIEVDSIKRELNVDRTVNRLVQDWHKENSHEEIVHGKGRLVVNKNGDERLSSTQSSRFLALHHVFFRALLPDPEIDQDMILAVIQLPEFEPKPLTKIV